MQRRLCKKLPRRQFLSLTHNKVTCWLAAPRKFIHSIVIISKRQISSNLGGSLPDQRVLWLCSFRRDMSSYQTKSKRSLCRWQKGICGGMAYLVLMGISVRLQPPFHGKRGCCKSGHSLAIYATRGGGHSSWLRCRCNKRMFTSRRSESYVSLSGVNVTTL